ncbi:MAG: NAD(+)/NADH kinase [Candidatus Krumholzibacteriota bacterium]|nr:NAD(+)/NADH kinase [Candidatus Krumholzibacteriota bacterium]
MKISRLGLAVNIYKADIADILKDVIELIPEGVEIIAMKEVSGLVPEASVRFANSYKNCDIVISLGGDGTFLRAARLVEREEIPLMGVKIRSLGFLTEDNLQKAMKDLFKGKCMVQERMRLKVSFSGKEKRGEYYSALNDIVIHGTGLSRVIHLKTTMDNTMLGEYLSDGVIISTPTGSTAYSLAAGGPIINPVTMQGMIITPLCPHSLSVRPVVVSSLETLQVEVVEKDQDIMLTIDGQKVCGLEAGEIITVQKSEKVTRLVTRRNYNFYDLVRKKLKWGGVLREH